MLGHLGLDQYGQKYLLGKHPRKDLLERLGRKHADKMYRDTASGEVCHVGYIIAGLWIEIFALSVWKETE